ncbi:MAG TPA: outer membrane lipoprotein-sorting protein [Desulfobacteraceae bacterium]|nr:outer membrane lipoprotein-sorting protein [Deltaproteobacteria bacterium]MBW2355795.1 outer membrane lipoprotein-sorting protein [Deltaproteobacteria bacterium]HDI59890.1 outer membrane lipoprotein-sorting protein [Desulfobacteraceae bacterium]
MQKILPSALVWLVLFLAPAAALAEPLTGEQVLKQVDRNLEPGNLEMYRKIINIEPDGKRKEYVLWFLRKDKDKVVTLFISPASEAGRATLRLGDNMWLYIPNVGKPIRITSMQSVVGGVFNNADIMRLDYSEEYAVAGMGEADGQILLELKARSGAVAYDRLQMRVDKARLVPVRIDCFAATGMLIKTLHFSDIKDIGGGAVRPAVMETESPLYKGYKSVMVSANLKLRELPDEVFTLNYLPRVKDLR